MLEVKQTHVKSLIDKESGFLVTLAEAVNRRKDLTESMIYEKSGEGVKTESQLIRSMKKLYNIVSG